MITECVAGFLFSEGPSPNIVALIQKNRPIFHQGMLNAIGGHIEQPETPYVAMRREFAEETGVIVNNWDQFLILQVPGWKIYFFRAKDNLVYKTRTRTDEKVSIYQLSDLPDLNVVPNLRWIIPMTLSSNVITAEVTEGAPI